MLTVMFETARRPLSRLFAAAFLMLSAMLVGFAHRPPAASIDSPIATVAGLVLPDGTFAGLCHTDFDDDGPIDRPLAAQHCDACRLSEAPGLGAVAEIGVPPPVDHPIDRLAPARPSEPTGVAMPMPRSRGPPALA